jgi:membrane-associated phospholipid phosphatase
VYTGFYLETFVTLLATPSGPDSKDWVNSKLKGIAVEGTALTTTALVTLGLREAIRRESPDGTKPTQFPSGHSSLGWGAVALSNRNLDSISMSNGARLTMQAGNYVLFASMAYSRVEGGEHFPRDVLFGMALGNFLTAFIHDSLIGLPEQPRYWFSVEPQRGGMTVSLSFRY